MCIAAPLRSDVPMIAMDSGIANAKGISTYERSWREAVATDILAIVTKSEGDCRDILDHANLIGQFIQQLEQILAAQLDPRNRNDVSDFDFTGSRVAMGHYQPNKGTEIWNAISVLRKRCGPALDKPASQRMLQMSRSIWLTISAICGLFNDSYCSNSRWQAIRVPPVPNPPQSDQVLHR